MGQFRVELTAVGGHGCQREIKDGGNVRDCGEPRCLDCITRRYVNDIAKTGSTIEAATFTHWPGTPEQVIDNLVTGERKGSFGG